jgi:hypothetical protein
MTKLNMVPSRDSANPERTPAHTPATTPANTPAAPEADAPPVVQRPDGWYWLAEAGRREVGPFDNADDALADWRSGIGSMLEPGETLQEAEAELGMSGWIDPETGAPAEDNTPRTEEH